MKTLSLFFLLLTSAVCDDDVKYISKRNSGRITMLFNIFFAVMICSYFWILLSSFVSLSDLVEWKLWMYICTLPCSCVLPWQPDDGLWLCLTDQLDGDTADVCSVMCCMILKASSLHVGAQVDSAFFSFLISRISDLQFHMELL